MGINTISVIGCNDVSSRFETAENHAIKVSSFSVKKSIYKNVLHIVGILIGCALLVSPQTLIPRHNSILYPRYWYELNFAVGYVFLFCTASSIMDPYVFTKYKRLISLSVFVRMYFWKLGGWLIPYCICYVVWSLCLGYNHPMPFLGFFCYLNCLLNFSLCFFSSKIFLKIITEFPLFFFCFS